MALERCPRCPSALKAFSHDGQVWLECLDAACGYAEGVHRIADPHPSQQKRVRGKDGVLKTRYYATDPKAAYRGRIPKPGRKIA